MEEGHDVKASLSIFMQTVDITSFTSLIKNTKASLESLQEQNGLNIFHEIANSISKEEFLLQFLDILVNEFKERYLEDSEQTIIKMINISTIRDKQTPLLMAIKHNRKKLVKKFVELGADVTMRNVYGQSLVHIAAECGFESILVYLCQVLKLCFSSTDMNGRTPLHVSALEGQTGTGLLLIAWTHDVNIQDLEGFTPLHLAALSQNYKLIRNLLIKNADTTIKDQKDETPLDIAISRENKEIIKLLQRAKCVNYLNPFHKKIGPVSNSYSKFVFYMLFFIFRAGLILIIIIPYLNEIFTFTSVGIFLITFLLFITVNCKDPGYTKNPKKLTLLTLLETYNTEFVCPYCEKRKTKNTRHCHYCQRCVQDLDHHCPWVHNCIGKNNHIWFIFFITFSVFDYAAQCVLGFFYYEDYLKGNFHSIYELRKERKIIGLIISSINAIGLLFVIPVFYLQLRLCWVNKHIKTRAKRKIEISDVVVYKSILEGSDTTSMLEKPFDDWNPQSITNQVSFLAPRIGSMNNISCCQHSTRSIY
ncbi:hypothetical protein SteCoe_35170 [Stentor coeruleus]|uniref:Palmitoyltransferase n=1 Tax=Stentor coeruleus TaxID=5963 RepID=A0A1R2ASX1_9CILI|nr:hypothetical protein SteCoe_35170 [Stentor coeruleus]